MEQVLFSKISNDKGHVLYKLLPEEREKIYEDVNVTLFFRKSRQRFKRSYVNRCLFSYIN